MTANGTHPDLFDTTDPARNRELGERVLEGMVRGLTNPPPRAGVECPHCKGSGMRPAATLGERVRALRLEHGLSTHELSKAVDGIVGASNIRQIELGSNDNPRLEVLRALAAYFNVRPGWLLDGDPE